MEEGIRRHDDMPQDENKTSTTIAPSPPSVTAIAASPRAGLCGYVIAPLALGPLDPPEFFDESDDERLAGLDLPAPAVAHDE